jgi:hypothetical protein
MGTRGKGRLPPAPARAPIGVAVSEGRPLPPLARIREALDALSPTDAAPTDKPQSVATGSPFSGRAVTYGRTTEALIDAALRHLTWVEQAIAEQDAQAAADRALALAALLAELDASSILKPLLTGRNKIEQFERDLAPDVVATNAKYDQWRTWQAELHEEEPRFKSASKNHQAKVLKERHSIPDAIGTIRKQLKPLSSSK